MADGEKSKLKLLYTYEILKKYSDEEHLLTANAICEKLSELYGITAERKSIYRDINTLMQTGIEIVSEKKSGFFLAERTFELAEIRFLKDAVLAADFVTAKKSSELIGKLCSELSVYQSESIAAQTYIDSGKKTGSEFFIYAIDTIHRAIALKKKVRFQYFRKRIEDGEIKRVFARMHEISPYALIWRDDKYYLVGNYGKYDDLSHYRIDRMGSVEITEEDARPFEEVCEYRDEFDAADYAARTFHMYTGETTQVKLLCENSIFEKVVDRIGENARYDTPDNDHFLVETEAFESEGLVDWLMMLGGSCRIIAPQSLKESVIARAGKIISRQEENQTNASV